jgi:hypothetical protein
MSLSQRIFQVWASSPYTPPKVPLIFYENEYMATVDDSQIFLRFMSSDGQIFLALNNNCQLGKPDPTIGDSVYICRKVDPILCSPTAGLDSIRDLFVLNNITPLLT